jgi:hypothetical protein
MTHAHTLVVVIVLALAAGCAESGGPGDPGDRVGTFCYDVNASGTETCLVDTTLTAMRSSTAGFTWFQVQGEITLAGWDPQMRQEEEVTETVTVFGQVVIGLPFPQPAENLVVSVPLAGECRQTIMISPFGTCDRLTHDTVCRAEAVYDSTFATVMVEDLSETEITLTVTGTLEVTNAADCCADDTEGCSAIEQPAAFTPAGPYTIDGHIRARFSE